MDIKDLLGYEGKTVVVTGAASGMAHCAAELLLSLGAKVWAVDMNDCDLPVEATIKGNLAEKDAIDSVCAQLPEQIDALFMCHGVGLKPGRETFIQLVNFVGQRYMAEKLVERIPDNGSVTFISSTGGYGWPYNMGMVSKMLDTASFEEAAELAAEFAPSFSDGSDSENALDPYQFSKQCLSAYVKKMCRVEPYIGRKIRINAIGPSFTATPLIADFEAATSKDGSLESGRDAMYELFLKSWNGRAGKPEEMGWPLVLIGSKVFSYLCGQIIYIDFGMTGEMDWATANK
ncbi:MAG: SDR family oxidoreductase [Coriobacteriales bacterium]|nr:SDR family oxidoreductase [Coriobacteriales bacterium]